MKKKILIKKIISIIFLIIKKNLIKKKIYGKILYIHKFYE